ncbi:MAG: ATP-binding protein [Thermoplasmata archaeon]
MTYENPFEYGKPVTGKKFIGRKKEVKRLTSELLSGQSIILYSPRRVGKTSLIKQTLTSIPANEAITAYVDLYGISSKRELVGKIVNETLRSAYPTYAAFKKFAEIILRRIPIKIISIKDIVKIELGRESDISTNVLEEAFDLPESIGQKMNKRVIVAFDEFQDIYALDGEHIEKLMRSRFQHHQKTAYIFAGSKTSMMQEMFGGYERAFYNFGTTMKIDNIPEEEFEVFIKDRFETTKKKIATDIIRRILAFTNGHPYFTQKICHRIWNDTEKVVNEASIKRTVDDITADEADKYERMWDSLTAAQRRFLFGLLGPQKKIYSYEFIAANDLKTASHVKKIFNSMLDKRIINERGEIADIFFREWLRELSDNISMDV